MRTLVVALAVVLAGCAPLPRIGAADEAWLLSGAAFGAGDADASVAAVPAGTDFLTLTPAMARFAEQAVAGASSDRQKVRKLLHAIIDPERLGLRFEESASYGAAEAFDHARANCLSFTAMYVAMARHVGLEAEFNEVDVPPAWNLRGADTMIFYRHVNALVRIGPGRRQAIDVFPEEYDTSYPQRVISDRLATAQHYNNLAMEALVVADARSAQRNLARAIAIDPDVSYLWANLGTSYRRAGQLRAAELAYAKALSLEPRDYVAIGNLARLYRDLGRLEESARLQRRATRFQATNPYYHYRQALDALAARHYDVARVRALRAVHMYEKEHRFHFLLGATYRALGERERAASSFERAVELADDERASSYRRKIDLLMSAVR